MAGTACETGERPTAWPGPLQSREDRDRIGAAKALQNRDELALAAAMLNVRNGSG